MKQPNFFILGAPKAGTTSLYQWLSEHPKVYMSEQKELEFFSTDLKTGDIEDIDTYESHFANATENHQAVGEASVWYLFSKHAVPNIEKRYESPRYIVMLRNPIEMAPSLHGQLVYAKQEHIQSYEEAWELSEQRRKGVKTKIHCKEPRVLDYKKVCKVGRQLERLLEKVQKERIHTVFLNDLKEDPKEEYRKALGFLGLKDDGRRNFENANPSGRWKSKILGSTIYNLKRIIKLARLKYGVKVNPEFGILNSVRDMNTKAYDHQQKLSEEVVHKMKQEYRKDVLKVRNITGRKDIWQEV